MEKDKQGRIIKIAAIVYAIDPRGEIRILMRHNKPYDGKHRDEWTFVWGAVEKGETFEAAAKREAKEEFGLTEYLSAVTTSDTTEYVGLHGASIAHYCLLKIPDIEVPITLNEESIGFDWMSVSDAKMIVRKNEKALLDQITSTR